MTPAEHAALYRKRHRYAYLKRQRERQRAKYASDPEFRARKCAAQRAQWQRIKDDEAEYRRQRREDTKGNK